MSQVAGLNSVQDHKALKAKQSLVFFAVLSPFLLPFPSELRDAGAVQDVTEPRHLALRHNATPYQVLHCWFTPRPTFRLVWVTAGAEGAGGARHRRVVIDEAATSTGYQTKCRFPAHGHGHRCWRLRGSRPRISPNEIFCWSPRLPQKRLRH